MEDNLNFFFNENLMKGGLKTNSSASIDPSLAQLCPSLFILFFIFIFVKLQLQL
jgi:hypothetical protein